MFGAENDHSPAQEELLNQLGNIVGRATQEWDMTPQEVIGCLEYYKHEYTATVLQIQNREEE